MQPIKAPLVRICAAAGLTEPIPEFAFAKPRRWRFDYAWPAAMIAIEIEGGVWTNGRHTRGSGFVKDMEKYNAAAIAGWRILRYTPDRLLYALADLREVLCIEVVRVPPPKATLYIQERDGL